MNFSTTQVSNIATFSSLLVLIAGHFNIGLTAGDATTIIAGGVALFSVVVNYWNKHNKGLTTILGMYKK